MDNDIRLKRILFRSAHRGTKESDILLGPFAEAQARSMREEELAEFERFLEEGDNDIWDWISGAGEPSEGRYAKLIERLRQVKQA